MIDFSTLLDLELPRGFVDQITNASGKLLWNNLRPAVLQVKKITDETYAAETRYIDESFVLLNIYPKKANSTVSVTYGDLTKTLTFNGTNAQQVFFGTFNGVTDSTETPAEGTLTIDGEYKNFTVGTYSTRNKSTVYCGCITAVEQWGNVRQILAYTFYECASLTNISISNKITSIGACAFDNCSALENVTIGAKVSGIIDGLLSPVFNGCSSLKYISVNSNNQYFEDIDGNLYRKKLYNNEDAKILMRYSPGKSETSMTIPEDVAELGIGAFADSAALTSITIPESITRIGSNAFLGCSALESVYITDIAKWCAINFGGGVATSPLSYAQNLYVNNALITELVIPAGVTAIPLCAFSCNNIASVQIPDSVTSIGNYAFDSCNSLTSVVIPDSVTSIGNYAFDSCNSLTSVVIPKGITELTRSLFARCTSLINVIIPNNITTINETVFSGCSALEQVILPDVPPTLVDTTAFDTTDAMLFVATEEIKTKYCAADVWSDLASRIYIYVTATIIFDANGGIGSMSTQTITGYGKLNANTFTSNTTGYRFAGWNTEADGSGTTFSNGCNIIIKADETVTLYAQWSNTYILTYMHSNRSNFYNSSGTGHQEIYELRINGVDQGKLGAFTNAAQKIPCTYGATIEVACTWWNGSNMSSADVNIYVNSSSISNNKDKRPSGYHPYGNSSTFIYPDGVESVAYYKFTLTEDTTIDFRAKTNAPAIINKEAYWDCYIIS